MSTEGSHNISPADDADATWASGSGATVDDEHWDDQPVRAADEQDHAADAASETDPNATWNPGATDPDDDDALAEDGPGGATATRPDGGPSTPQDDPDATCDATRTLSAADVWGDDFDDVTPGHTLKGPQAAKPAPGQARVSAGPGPSPKLSLDGYDLLNVLGEGGVGVVYQAVQKSIGRNIAVKMIKAGVGQNVEEKEKFVAEARVTGKLDHPNIVPIHDLGTTPDGQPFYTMKMVRGTPWGDVLRQKSREENLNIFLDVCDAVSFAHSKSVVHRDLKPDNVMLGEFGEVQLMDWGLGAPVTDAGELADLRRTQAAGGTPAYMAPEMVTGENAPVGIYSDVYLLGAILHQIITGQPPHGGTRVLDVLENALNNVIQPAEQGGVLMDVALKAMRTVPAERHSSVNELKQAVLEYRANAESIKLCERSSEHLRHARQKQDYEAFAQALFGFREALSLWQENADARVGVVETQRAYAQCAFEKGDLDLAASTLDSECADHQGLAAEVRRAQQARAQARRRLRRFRIIATALTAAVIVILTVASIWIYNAKREEETAKEDALAAKEAAVAAKGVAYAAREAEAAQRKQAEEARGKAQAEEARAVKALADLEQAYADLVEAQEQERHAWAQARESERIATETRDELAKSGMLLDNSWWVFDSDEAKRRQEEAAASLERPAEMIVTLADGVGLELVLVPPGSFVMGSPPTEENRAADEHLHRVHHGAAFYMARYELTESQWHAVTGRAPGNVGDRAVDPALPAAGISFIQIAEDLLPALRQQAPEGWEFRLPTEAEWEYACRSGTGTAYHGGDDEEALDGIGWFLSNSERQVQPVGGKLPNAFGLRDLHGNVAEMCVDQYLPSFYLESPVDDPVAPAADDTPVVRGGSVMNTPMHCRTAYRSYIYRKNEYPFVGLRLVLAPIRESVATTQPGTDEQTAENP